LIEASPKAYERLLNNYLEFKDREFDLGNVAIGKEDGVLEFYESDEHLKRGDVGLLSTGVPSEMDRWGGTQQFEPMTVPMESVATMLSRSRFHRFDLLSIDIEGMELDVLPQIKFKELGVLVAVIEWNSKNQRAYDNIMLPQGFKLKHRNAENLIYAR
jgi:FkbM family methyltransferase